MQLTSRSRVSRVITPVLQKRAGFNAGQWLFIPTSNKKNVNNESPVVSMEISEYVENIFSANTSLILVTLASSIYTSQTSDQWFREYYIVSIDANAMKAHKIKKIKDGKCLLKGLFILRWKYWAANINNPIRIEGIKINGGYQIPIINKVAKEILEAPTKFRIKSLNPNSLNSFMITSYRKTQT